MAERRTITLIRGRVDAAAALEGLGGLLPDAVVGNPIYYPYLAYRASARVPALGGRRRIDIACLVDGVNALAATADPYVADTVSVAHGTLIDTGVTREAAGRAARRTVVHRVGRRARMIAHFDVELEFDGVVYKRFWIARSGARRVMIDSVTGGLHGLASNAA